jgi:cobalt-precorrin 5A hydrolase/precorrin-3B C17-methyltransferase
VVVGYGGYLDLVDDLLTPGQLVLRSPIGAETDRCRESLARAAAGQRVALVCSGDAGVYAMASLVCELAPLAGDPPVTVVPGVTAALSGAAVLGAPLGHDHAAISLSDLLTPWEVIVRRLQAAAAGDFVVSLYNPRSQRRHTQLPSALGILGAHRPASTPAAILTDIGRPGQHIVRTTVSALDPGEVGMLSLVIVGATATRWIGDRMVTPRGYRDGPPGSLAGVSDSADSPEPSP